MHPADSNYEITLDSNRTIALDELHQHLTYAGLLVLLLHLVINQ